MFLRKLMFAALAAAMPAIASATTVEVTVRNNSTSGTALLGTINCTQGCTPSFSTSISHGASTVFSVTGTSITGFLQYHFDVSQGTGPTIRACRASMSVNFDPATGQAISVAGTSTWSVASAPATPTCAQLSSPVVSAGKVLWSLSFVGN